MSPSLEISTELIDRARRGDEAARNGLCASLEPRVMAIVQAQFTGSARRWSQPQDVVQQLLFELLAGLDTLTEGHEVDELTARVRKLAGWRIKDLQREHRRDVGESALPGGPDERPCDPASQGEITKRDLSRWIHELVRRLPTPASDVVRLCALEGLSYLEAGAQLGKSSEAVRKIYKRTQDMLTERVRARLTPGSEPGAPH